MNEVGTILMILGIALIVMGLILMLAVPVGGILGVLAGIAAIIYGRKYNKEKKTEKEIAVESLNADIEEFKVAGFDYRQEELEQLFETLNEEYALPQKRFAEEVIDRVYQFETEWKDAKIIREPENEYDPNAIAVYVDDVKIGYIQKKDQARFNKLNPASAEVELYGGQYKEPVFDDYGEFEKIETGQTPYKATLYIRSQ